MEEIVHVYIFFIDLAWLNIFLAERFSVLHERHIPLAVFGQVDDVAAMDQETRFRLRTTTVYL